MNVRLPWLGSQKRLRFDSTTQHQSAYRTACQQAVAHFLMKQGHLCFFSDGLVDTVVGISQLAWMAGSAVYQANEYALKTISPLNAAELVYDWLDWYWGNEDTHGDSNQKLFQRAEQVAAGLAATWETLGDAGRYAKAIGNDLIDLQISGALSLLLNGDLSQLKVQLRPETELALDLALYVAEIIWEAVENTLNDLWNKSDAEKSYMLGRLIGMIAFEVAATVVSGGLAVAAKAAMASRWVRKLENITGVSKLNGRSHIVEAVNEAADGVVRALNSRLCFVAGTPVHTSTGLRPIEQVEPGDLVLTRSETAAGTAGPPEYRQVLHVFVTRPESLLGITVRSQDEGEEDILWTTPNHPFFELGRAGFVNAGELLIGDRLALPEGRSAEVVGLESQGVEDKDLVTYNFAVEGTRTYFVGRLGVWVHNTGDAICQLAAAKYFRRVRHGMPHDRALALVDQDIAELASRPGYRNMSRRELDDHIADAMNEIAIAEITGPIIRRMSTQKLKVTPEHRQAIASHLADRQAKEAAVRRHPEGSQAWKKAYDDWIRSTEMLGEKSAKHLMATDPRYKDARMLFHDSGSNTLDMVYYDAKKGIYYVVEAKGGSGGYGHRLLPNGRVAGQGTREYLEETLKVMGRDGGAASNMGDRGAIAKELLKLLNNPETRGKVQYLGVRTPVTNGPGGPIVNHVHVDQFRL